jgi:NDP-sugar pyrophosphorylase family protein
VDAVILAGGRGTRLAPYTTVLPKPLMPVGERPVLEIILGQLEAQGFERAIISVGYLSQLIESFFGDGSSVGIRIEYIREDEPLGTAGPLGLLGEMPGPFLVMNGDVLSALDYGHLVREHAESGAEATVASVLRTHTVDFGVIESDEAGRITDYIEKPTHEYAVSMGVYALSPGVTSLVSEGQHLDLPDLMLQMMRGGRAVRTVRFEGRWLDIGRHEDFASAQEILDAEGEDAFLSDGSGTR